MLKSSLEITVIWVYYTFNYNFGIKYDIATDVELAGIILMNISPSNIFSTMIFHERFLQNCHAAVSINGLTHTLPKSPVE